MFKKRDRRRFHRRTTPGSAPGIIVADPQAPQPRIFVTAFNSEGAEQTEVQRIEEIEKFRSRGSVLWVDVEGLGDAETIRELGRLFDLHELALEDVVNVHQQVKVEDYVDHLFVIGRLVDDCEIGITQQVSLFLGQDFVVTFQERPADWLAPLRERLGDPRSQLRARGADFLAYAILDALVDGYFPMLETYGEQLDAVEDLITGDPPDRLIHELHAIRSVLRSLRRTVWQHREAISKLLHDPTPLVNDETRTFLRDCYDHTLQLVDLIEIYHETCMDLRDMYLSTVSNRLNEVMKVLTIIATVFIPLSFITGLYGMNFNPKVSRWNMPELNWFYGYPFALGLMCLVSFGLLSFCYWRGWLWRKRD